MSARKQWSTGGLRRVGLAVVLWVVLLGGVVLPGVALAAPEAPVTLSPAQSVTATSAILEGTLNPGASAKAGWFFYYSNPGGGSCVEAATPPAPEVTGKALLEHAEVTGLQPGRKYLFCMAAYNELGEVERSANEVSFTTNPSAPTVDSQSVSVTSFDATLEGLVNPNNQETTYHLEFATDKAFTEGVRTFAYGIAAPGVYGDQRVGPVDLGGGLAAGTTYYYRVVAKNATGEVEGTVEHPVGEFTTLPAKKPSIEGEKLVGATLTSDTIEAQLNPNNQGVAECLVEYVTKETYEVTAFTENIMAVGCAPVPPAQGFGQGGSPVAFTATLSDLQEGKAYEYRVLAINGTGTFEGAPQLLTRTPPQLAGLPAVEAITRHTVLIAPPGITPEVPAPVTATYYVLYGTNEANEQASARVSAGSGLAPNTVASIELYGLQPGTTYHYAIVAYNGNGTKIGPEATFTTAPGEPLTATPTVGGQTAQFVNEGSAVIEAELNPQGQETSYEVQYGTTTAYGSSAQGPTPLAPYTTAEGTITALTGLAPGTTYHYRLAATNQAGTSYGQDATFTTTGAARTTAFTAFAIPTVPLIAATPAVFPVEEPGTTGTTPKKARTKTHKLAAALRACRAKKNHKKRASCEANARRKARKKK